MAIDPEPVPKALGILRERIAACEKRTRRAAEKVAGAAHEQTLAAEALERAQAAERDWLEANPRRQLELL